jgi:3-hydroxyacyl-CoA dehydrogenase/enoyl-CoA hydratase/3-hydroxybutyryl-CoA epimerase
VPMLAQKTKGLMPAPEKILDVIANTLRVDFDTALRIESRALTGLVTSPQAKNMMTFFLQMNQVNGGGSRPKDIAKTKVKKVGILGAGMMGQGIAYVSARAGMDVVLKDISQDAADKGKAYSDKILTKAISRGRMTEEKKADILGRITATVDAKALQGCDLIIEAVFENVDLKHDMTRDLEPLLADGGVWGSNTSTLPITLLAEASVKPENFIGVHFFSPVDKMPLVEIIVGDQTSAETLAKAFDYALQIKKTPIVVNDSRGFFTSRVFGTFVDEGAILIEEGVEPVLIESLAKLVGMPVGPLAVHDEVSQQLTKKVVATNRDLNERLGGNMSVDTASARMSNVFVDEYKRNGKAYEGGYYDYGTDGSKTIWPTIRERFVRADVAVPNQDVKERILFRQVVESVRCLEEGVLKTVADGNIGSIMGIGFPPYTGGVFQYINTYGVQKFADRAAELSALYGERFNPPALLLKKAADGELFA